jgi:cell division protein FtsB
MLGTLFAPLAMKISAGITAVLLIALGVMFLIHKHDLSTADKLRNEVATVNAKLAVSNASIAELQASLSRYVGAGKAAQVAQLAAVEAQAKDNAALQGQADAIRAEMAKLPAGKCETPKTVITAKGL